VQLGLRFDSAVTHLARDAVRLLAVMVVPDLDLDIVVLVLVLVLVAKSLAISFISLVDVPSSRNIFTLFTYL